MTERTKVVLTAALIRALMTYDPETGILTWKPRPPEMFPARNRKSIHAAWHAKNAGKEACACIDAGYRHGGLFYHKIRAHRAAWAIMTGEIPKGEIDHINGDGTDNRWVNLRLVTNTENARNQKRHNTNTSGHTGVTWDAQASKWLAYFWDGRTSKKIAKFDSLEDAAKAASDKRALLGYHENHGTIR